MANELSSVIVLLLAWNSNSVVGFPDQTPAAITIYKNPELYDNQLNSLYDPGQPKRLAGEPDENYKYPGETKKPNVPTTGAPGVEVTYDTSPEFNPAPRDILVNNVTPKRRKGPYSPLTKGDSDLVENSEVRDLREFSGLESLEGDVNEEESIDRDPTYSNKNNGPPGGGYGIFNGPISQDFTGFNEASLRFALLPHSQDNSNSNKFTRKENFGRDLHSYGNRESREDTHGQEIGSTEMENNRYYQYGTYDAGTRNINSYNYDGYRNSEIRPVREEYEESGEFSRESLEDGSYENEQFDDEDVSRSRESTESFVPTGDVQMFL
ncbi:hypothetical protein RUM44_001084 [Polyplax serrata]|uniref:Uncharacterized protein n=1 Tax=Polyplax serrata TaxID=468196 RepID=A0ABR1B6M8_POLSC